MKYVNYETRDGVKMKRPELSIRQACYLDHAMCHMAYESLGVDRLLLLNNDWNNVVYKGVYLSEEEKRELLESVLEKVDHVERDVFTDSEGCTYNSIVWKDGGIYETYIKNRAKEYWQ